MPGFEGDLLYPHFMGKDFAAAGEIDIRNFQDIPPPSSNVTIAQHSNEAGEIVLDPFTTRGTVGAADAPNFGWALNRSLDNPISMKSASDAKRYIRAGQWSFNARVGVVNLSLSQVLMRVRVYRVSATGSRSLLFSSVTNSVTPTVTGNNLTALVTVGEITFEADETLLVSFSIEKTNSGLGTASGVQFRLNDANIGSQITSVQLPGPIRTRYFRGPFSALSTGLANWIRKYSFRRSTDSPAMGISSMSRTLTLFRTFAATGTGVSSVVRKVAKPLLVTSIGVASAIKKVGKPLSATATGATALLKKVGKSFAATAIGNSAMSRTLSLHRTFVDSTVGVAAMNRALTLRRALTVATTVVASALAKLPFGNIPSSGGGTIIKRVTNYIFDD